MSEVLSEVGYTRACCGKCGEDKFYLEFRHRDFDTFSARCCFCGHSWNPPGETVERGPAEHAKGNGALDEGGGVAHDMVSAAEAKVRRGRPLLSEAHLTLTATKPWEAEGKPRSTWYRHRRDKGEGV